MFLADCEDVFRSHCPARRKDNETNTGIIRGSNRRDNECQNETGDVQGLDVWYRTEPFYEYGLCNPTNGKDEECRERNICGVIGENVEKTKSSRGNKKDDEVLQHQAIHGYLIQEIINVGHLIFGKRECRGERLNESFARERCTGNAVYLSILSLDSFLFEKRHCLAINIPRSRTIAWVLEELY